MSPRAKFDSFMLSNLFYTHNLSKDVLKTKSNFDSFMPPRPKFDSFMLSTMCYVKIYPKMWELPYSFRQRFTNQRYRLCHHFLNHCTLNWQHINPTVHPINFTVTLLFFRNGGHNLYDQNQLFICRSPGLPLMYSIRLQSTQKKFQQMDQISGLESSSAEKASQLRTV